MMQQNFHIRPPEPISPFEGYFSVRLRKKHNKFKHFLGWACEFCGKIDSGCPMEKNGIKEISVGGERGALHNCAGAKKNGYSADELEAILWTQNAFPGEYKEYCLFKK